MQSMYQALPVLLCHSIGPFNGVARSISLLRGGILTMAGIAHVGAPQLARGRAPLDLMRAWGARILIVTADQHDRVTAAGAALARTTVFTSGLDAAELTVDVAGRSEDRSPR